jgi:sarcosine oxidase subunit gamma
MVELAATSAFDGLLARSVQAEAPVWIEPVPATIVGLRARHGAVDLLEARLKERFGLGLPRSLGVFDDGLACVVGVGPGAWWVVSERGEPCFANLRSDLGGMAAVVDQSAGQAILRIDGPGAADLLSTGLFLDLHPKAFPPGSAASSVLAHIRVTLWRRASGAFELACPRSFAAALAHWADAPV